MGKNKVSNKFNTLVYIRPTEKCNLRCKHCFIPPNPATMTDEQILNIPMQLSGAGVSGNVLLQWHGGEPLLIDPIRCERLIIELGNIENDFNINFIHGVQTNLVVLKSFSKNKHEKWLQVLATYFDLNLIGVSWDKDIRAVNLKSQQYFQDDFEQTIFSMRNSKYFQDDFSPAVTITAAKPFLKSISKLADSTVFFKWLERHMLHKIHVEKLTPTGDAIKNWNEIGVDNFEYSKIMSKFYLSYKRFKNLNPESELAISPFCDLEDAIKTGKQDNICASGSCQTNIFTFSNSGIVKSCTAIAKHNSLNLKAYRNNVQANCVDCEFNTICSGGCPAHNNVVDESGECSGAKKLLTTIKEICNV